LEKREEFEMSVGKRNNSWRDFGASKSSDINRF